jgi:lambda family phage portal protein
MKQNALDRLIGYVAPVAYARRLKARATAALAEQAVLSYDAIKVSRPNAGWRSIQSDANGEVSMAGLRLSNIASDMVRNNAHANRALQVISEGVVGAGIIPNVVCDSPSYRARLQKLIKLHCDTTAIDADGRHNLYGLQNLVMRGVPERGEAFIRMIPRTPDMKLPLPFQLQVLEADFLNRNIDGLQPNGNLAIQGVEFDRSGSRVAYHFFRQHPGSMTPLATAENTRVPAYYVAHIYRVDRPGQVRGVTWFAPVIVRMRDYADYVDAQLVRQKIAACFAVFVKHTDGMNVLGTDKSKDTGLPLESVEPGMIERLRPGEDVSFGMPPMVEGFADYSAVTLQEIAVGLGVDYASLTGDNSRSNFANSRMGWLRYHRSIESWQSNMLVPAGCDPIGGWILDTAAAVIGSRYPAQLLWTPPRREMFDPAKDIKASTEAIQAGLSSRPYEQRRLGFDPEDLDAEIAISNNVADGLGLKFTSDGRFATIGSRKPDQEEDQKNGS